MAKKGNILYWQVCSSFEKDWRRFYKHKSDAKIFNIFVAFVRAYLDHDCDLKLRTKLLVIKVQQIKFLRSFFFKTEKVFRTFIHHFNDIWDCKRFIEIGKSQIKPIETQTIMEIGIISFGESGNSY
ncbi:hypothetical protein BpHYR1_023469 [Brachionus plicatilis]|uniref:Uncharacterized protein n=1 Tax=Brachionus plicatilis TaxID=10195 RepID=A0A3M7QAR6_BRAPC|nr:hypothetical protein BpHYR1_023469 [Brachionus plicatilis]